MAFNIKLKTTKKCWLIGNIIYYAYIDRTKQHTASAEFDIEFPTALDLDETTLNNVTFDVELFKGSPQNDETTPSEWLTSHHGGYTTIDSECNRNSSKIYLKRSTNVRNCVLLQVIFHTPEIPKTKSTIGYLRIKIKIPGDQQNITLETFAIAINPKHPERVANPDIERVSKPLVCQHQLSL